MPIAWNAFTPGNALFGGAVIGLASAPAQRVVRVGAGYTGLEVAEGLLARGLDVTVIERLDASMGAVLNPDMAAPVAYAMRAAGIDLRLCTAVTRFAVVSGRVTAVETAAGAVAAALVVIRLSVCANADLARAAGIGVGQAGGIIVDDHRCTGASHVWAAGDCVESRHRITGRAIVVALGTLANKQGRVASTNIADGDASSGGVLGTAIARFRSVEIGRTGLTEREATAAGFDAIGVTTDAPSRAPYFPGAHMMRIKILVERRTGRLLGAQIVGGEGVGKRIDVLATALWNDMTVMDVGGMDPCTRHRSRRSGPRCCWLPESCIEDLTQRCRGNSRARRHDPHGPKSGSRVRPLRMSRPLSGWAESDGRPQTMSTSVRHSWYGVTVTGHCVMAVVGQLRIEP